MLLFIFLDFPFGFMAGTKSSTKLNQIRIELRKEVQTIKGIRGSIHYILYDKDFKNRFVIVKGSISEGNHNLIADLPIGTKVDVFIASSDYSNLGTSKNDITIRQIMVGNKVLMSKEEFSENTGLYGLRVRLVKGFTGIMLIINGLSLISKKANYLIIGIFIGLIILMRIMDIGLY